MGIFDEEIQMNDIDRRCAECHNALKAIWKDYSIYVLTNGTAMVFKGDTQSELQRLVITSELLKHISYEVGFEYDDKLPKVDTIERLIGHINIQQSPKVIRTIHPVGQGAMYSERFLDKDGNTTFLTVYDCGSQSPRKLEQEISSSFSETDNIDLLFISHLDRDHVNGIKKLQKSVNGINNVVLPLVPSWLKPILLLMADDEVSEQIMTSPEDFFKDSNIIYVRSAWEISDGASLLNLPLQGDESVEIDSGTRIKFSTFGIPDWCYIPYNYDEVVRVNDFLVELQNAGIKESDLSDPCFIDENRPKLQEIYKKVCGSVNDSSLVVYSGGWHSTYSSRYVCDLFRRSRQSAEACLYLGDSNLHQTDKNASSIMVSDLKSRLSAVNSHIGTIQLPHHGSVKNFHGALFSYGLTPKVYFASCGIKRPYGHPSTLVLGQILFRNEDFCLVTDQCNSTLFQFIKL